MNPIMNPNERKVKESMSRPSFQSGNGPLGLKIPARVLGGIRRNFVLWILGLAVIVNLYLTLANQNGRALIIPGFADGQEVAFSKTIIFWTPDFSQGRCDPRVPQSSERIFNARLEQKFGGWTRWRVSGNGPEGTTEDGWFYQVSLAKSAPSVSLEDLEALLKGCFRQNSYYVIEHPHR